MLYLTNVNKDGCSPLSRTTGKGTQELDRGVEYSFNQQYFTNILTQQCDKAVHQGPRLYESTSSRSQCKPT